MAIIKEFNPEKQRIKMLLIGEPKKGKTLTAASFPKPFIADFEGGWAAHAAKYPNIHYGVYMDKNPLIPTAFEEFLRDFNTVLRSPDYETIVLDTLGTMQAVIKNRSLSMKRKRWGTEDGLGDGIKMAVQEDWNYIAGITKTVVERACASDKHVIVTSHLITKTASVSDDAGTREVPVSATVDFVGDSNERLTFQKRFDIFCMADPEIRQKGKEVEFIPRLRMKPVGKLIPLGSRWDCFDVYEEPSFNNLMSKMTAYNDALIKAIK